MKAENLSILDLESHLARHYPYYDFSRGEQSSLYTDVMPFLQALGTQSVRCDVFSNKADRELVIHFKANCSQEFKSLKDEWLDFEVTDNQKAENNGTFLYICMDYYAPEALTWEKL